MLTESFNLGFSKPGGTVNLSSMAVELVARVRQGLAQVLIPQSFPFFFFLFLNGFPKFQLLGWLGRLWRGWRRQLAKRGEWSID
jgi:hypothetical protein